MKNLTYIIGFAAFLFIMGVAGNYDWAEEVLESVPCELYQEIKKEIGGDPSEVKIAEYYLDNKKRLDTLAYLNGW